MECIRHSASLGCLRKQGLTFLEKHLRSCIKEECRCSRTCNDVFWTVHTDHTVTAVKSSQCGDQRREADHTAFWKICSEAGWNKIKSFLFSERRGHKKTDIGDDERIVRSSCFRWIRKKLPGWMVFPLGERRQPVRNFQEEMENIFLLF